MERFTRLSGVLALAVFALVCAHGKAQVARSIPAAPAPQPKARQTAPRPMPFSLGGARPEAGAPLAYLSSDQMSQQDRDLWTSAQTAISQRASAGGLDFNQGTWDAGQIVCSALPDHLFLTFTRGSGTGQASAFTASIPRSSGGQVRVIPILRRGYSLFSPAAVNEQTISAFNHIRAEEHPAQPSEWLATGLCYAALAGAHPQVDLAGDEKVRKDPTALPGSLTISPSSGGAISFIDLNANPRRNLWTMNFDGGGKLLAVTLTKSQHSREKVVQRSSVEVQSKPVPQSAEVHGKPVPQSQVDPRGKLVSATEPTARAIPVQ